MKIFNMIKKYASKIISIVSFALIIIAIVKNLPIVAITTTVINILINDHEIRSGKLPDSSKITTIFYGAVVSLSFIPVIGTALSIICALLSFPAVLTLCMGYRIFNNDILNNDILNNYINFNDSNI